MEIKGKYGEATCYASAIDSETINQIKTICDFPISEGAKIVIMPDCHAGKGCVIGTTMKTNDKICPNLIGVDIGCGMFAVKLKEKDIDYQKLDEVVHEIPSGRDVWDADDVRRTPFPILKFVHCYDELRDINWLRRSLGTLGGGNHFIEVDEEDDGTKWLVIHTGSRNLGKQVADIYQRKAIKARKRDQYLSLSQDIISKLKAEGREREIESELRKLKDNAVNIPDDLCYLEGKQAADYLDDMMTCQLFALANRVRIAQIILKEAGLHSEYSFETMHNYIERDPERRFPDILRKGAISAKKGEKVIIPMNMRDGVIIATGLGNPDWNYSAPHGAGRVMSRNEARLNLSLDEYQSEMKGIYSSSICNETIDEAPMAYKSMDSIINEINGKTVTDIKILKPVYNFKAKG